MYLNTFICLEENVTGYGAKQKRPSGHVTISTPGVVKCYVQDLRPLSTKDYVLYAMGKDKKAVRLGKLNSPSQNKQTLWNIDISNVNGQNINAKDIDCVAVVIEGESIGNTDTIMIGHMKDKYLITTLLEPALPRRTLQKAEPTIIAKTPAASVKVPEREINLKPTMSIPLDKGIQVEFTVSEETDKQVDKQVEEKVDLLEEQVRMLINKDLYKKCEENRKNPLLKENPSLRENLLLRENPIKNILGEFIRAQQESDTIDQIKENAQKDVDKIEVDIKEADRSNEIDMIEETVEEIDYIKDLEDRLKGLKKSLVLPKQTTEQAIIPDSYPCESCKKQQQVIKDNKYNRVKEIFEDSTPTTPFKGINDSISWVMMSTAELISIPELSYEWCTQPFITYCYHKFNHLILGKDNEIEQYYVGIPDIYYPNRRYILSLDKIESFRCCEDKNPAAGDFGYWMVRI